MYIIVVVSRHVGLFCVIQRCNRLLSNFVVSECVFVTLHEPALNSISGRCASAKVGSTLIDGSIVLPPMLRASPQRTNFIGILRLDRRRLDIAHFRLHGCFGSLRGVLGIDRARANLFLGTSFH